MAASPLGDREGAETHALAAGGMLGPCGSGRRTPSKVQTAHARRSLAHLQPCRLGVGGFAPVLEAHPRRAR